MLTSPVLSSSPCEAQDESADSGEPQADHSVTLEFTKICKVSPVRGDVVTMLP